MPLYATSWLSMPRIHIAEVEELKRRPGGNVDRQDIVTLCGRRAHVALHYRPVEEIKDSALPGAWDAAGHCGRCFAEAVKRGVPVVHDTASPGPNLLGNMFRVRW